VLRAGVGAVALAWMPAFRVPAALGLDGCVTPPRFPAHIPLYKQAFENWAKAIVVDDLWTCAPRNAGEVADLVNWGHRKGWRIRPRGSMHNWSPLCITADTGCDDRVVLVDTTEHLTGLELVDADGPAIRAGAGATMEQVATFAEVHGFGFAALPAVGDVTVGGGLAIGMHGAVLPARGERLPDGHTYGSLANLVVSLEAVVWSPRRRRYVVRTFERSHPDAAALLVHLGRAFVTSATLRVAPNQNLRCVSRVDIPARELFAAPGSGGETMASFVEETGRAEAIWFPFTENPWLKVWSVSPQKPPGSREVGGPYNYVFSDNLPEPVTDLVKELISGNGAVAPLFAQTEFEIARAGLTATQSLDIWGKSKNTLFYIRPTTLRLDEFGYAVLTKRKHLQRVIHVFTSFYERRLDELRAQGAFPVNGPLEIRACGLDRAVDSGIRGARAPALAATVPRRDRPQWDVAVFMNGLTFPRTPGEYAYFRELERFVRSTYRGWAAPRVEWSKGFAFSENAIWANKRILSRRLPRSLSIGRPRNANWDWAVATLDRYDPHRVLSNGFLDRLLR